MGIFSNRKKTSEDEFQTLRERMVEYQLESRDVRNPSVLAVMRKVPRHLFVSADIWRSAYDDSPQQIGCKQTISQPYIVASMTEHLDPGKNKRVLEIGTGSGYQTAVLAELFDHVDTVEYFSELSSAAQKVLDRLGYSNISFHVGDGLEIPDVKEEFDAIIVTAAPKDFPDILIERLRPGGRLVIPVGEAVQQLKLVTKEESGRVKFKILYAVRFVPLQHADRKI
jgi:protein-L-isoaspartate(D-aspartate) O-methyltransferase